MKLTRDILEKLEFTKNGKIYTNWKLDLYEDEENIFSVKLERIYFDIDTVEELHNFWKIIKAEETKPLPIHLL